VKFVNCTQIYANSDDWTEESYFFSFDSKLIKRKPISNVNELLKMEINSHENEEWINEKKSERDEEN
jgi:hypothetical protein